MNPEEAIFWVNDTKYIYENMNPDMQLSRLKCEAFVLSIQALEKQVPKSYDIRCNASGVCYDCPECGVKIDRYDKYCFNCGQKINWEETP